MFNSSFIKALKSPMVSRYFPSTRIFDKGWRTLIWASSLALRPRLTNSRRLALPIFAVVIFTVYYLAISSVGGFLTDFINDTVFGPNGIPYFVETFLTNINAAGWLIGLIVDGIIGGVGAVLGFLPQMLVLFLLLGFLEDTGYMSRIAFILDKIFRKFGLSGKSFIPMLISTGCAVPGIMATRTIGNRSERRITMTTT